MKPRDEVASLLGGMDEQDGQYLRERPWMIEEYRRQGFNDEMDVVAEGGHKPAVSPEESTRVTTDDLRQGVIPVLKKPVQNGVVPSDEDDELEDDYEGWTKSDLEAEIDERNQARGDGEKLPKGGTKQELVDRLRSDDESVVNV
jgi:hypothetical protein